MQNALSLKCEGIILDYKAKYNLWARKSLCDVIPRSTRLWIESAGSHSCLHGLSIERFCLWYIDSFGLCV